jgi:hypothetical protein
MQIDPDVDLWNLGRRDRMSTVSLSVFTEPTRRVAHIHDLSLVGTCIIEARHTALNYKSANEIRGALVEGSWLSWHSHR